MTVISDRPIEGSRAIPRSALALGLAGLIPFWALAIAAIVLDGAAASRAVAANILYGAVILSFLGGIRWGLAMHPLGTEGRDLRFVLSVTPSLVGWAAALLAPVAGLATLIAGLALQGALDVAEVRAGRAPVWFGRLRIVLTTGATIALAATLVAAW